MRSPARHALPRGVIALGFVSLFMDVSSEMIHSLLPVYLTGPLGLSAIALGLIEGAAEAVASFARIFSGALSDWWGRRKLLILLGYGLAAATKPLFPLASGASVIFAARFLDRIGKGIRGAPRDALIADLTPEAQRGQAYGARQAMDTAGAFAGPALALLLMTLSGANFPLVFWAAVLPALCSVGCLAFGVHEPPGPGGATARRPFPLRRGQIAGLPAAFWLVLALLAVLTLARFSEAFLILRVASFGLAPAATPLVLILMNAVYAASAYPLGRLADRYDRRRLLRAGILLLPLAALALANATSLAGAFLGCALWGLHLGATQGLLSALVAAASPAALRATAFGLVHLTAGLATLAASPLAGLLWQSAGPAAPFQLAAAVSAAALVLTLFLPEEHAR